MIVSVPPIPRLGGRTQSDKPAPRQETGLQQITTQRVYKPGAIVDYCQAGPTVAAGHEPVRRAETGYPQGEHACVISGGVRHARRQIDVDNGSLAGHSAAPVSRGTGEVGRPVEGRNRDCARRIGAVRLGRSGQATNPSARVEHDLSATRRQAAPGARSRNDRGSAQPPISRAQEGTVG